MSLKRRLISVDENTYQALKNRGHTGDSFNQVIKIILGAEINNELLGRKRSCKFASSNKRSTRSTPNTIAVEDRKMDQPAK